MIGEKDTDDSHKLEIFFLFLWNLFLSWWVHGLFFLPFYVSSLPQMTDETSLLL